MSDDLGSYARLYVALRDDPKFRDVYPDDHHFATYVRLLMIAEDAWPASAHLPYGLNRRSLQKLCDVGLIETKGHGMYRVSGLDAERNRRNRENRNGGVVRAETAERGGDGRFLPSTAGPALATTAGSQRVQPAKPSQDETSQDTPSTARGLDDPADAYWSLTGRYPTGRVLAWIDQLAAQFGGEAVTRSLAKAHISDPGPSTLMGRSQDLLRAEARALDRAEQEAEKERLREKRAIPKVIPAWEQEYRAALEAKYGTA